MTHADMAEHSRAPLRSQEEPVPSALGFLRERMGRMPYASLYVVGTHGGAGESTIAGLHPQWFATKRRWPTRQGAAPACLLVARTHASGLLAAQQYLQAWKFGELAAPVTLVGLVLNADAPGRLPKPLRELSTVVAAGAPRAWHLPWNESWRTGNPATDEPGSEAQQLLADVATLAASAGGTPTPR